MTRIWLAVVVVVCAAICCQGQSTIPADAGTAEHERLLRRIEELERRLAALEKASAPAESLTSESTGGSAAQSVAESAGGDWALAPSEPFAFADFTWLNGNSRTHESPLDSKVFTGEFRIDSSYIFDFNRPRDHTLVGSSESGRTQEVQVQQLGVGGDFHYDHVRGRLMTQFGMHSTMWVVNRSQKPISEIRSRVRATLGRVPDIRSGEL